MLARSGNVCKVRLRAQRENASVIGEVYGIALEGIDRDQPVHLVDRLHRPSHEAYVGIVREQRAKGRRNLPAGRSTYGELVEHREEGESVAAVDECHACPWRLAPVQLAQLERSVQTTEASAENAHVWPVKLFTHDGAVDAWRGGEGGAERTTRSRTQHAPSSHLQRLQDRGAHAVAHHWWCKRSVQEAWATSTPNTNRIAFL